LFSALLSEHIYVYNNDLGAGDNPCIDISHLAAIRDLGSGNGSRRVSKTIWGQNRANISIRQ